MKSARTMIPAPLCCLIFMGMMAGLACSLGTLSPEEFEERYGKPIPAGAKSDEPSMFEGPAAARMLDKLKSEVGSTTLNIQEITIHDQHATVRIEQPGTPGTILDYNYLNRSFQKPRKSKVGASTTENGFSSDAIDLENLPKFIEKAREVLDRSDLTPSHILIERDSRSGDVTIAIYLHDSTGDSSRVVLSKTGSVIRTYR